MGVISKDGMDFLCELGRFLTQCTDDHRESAFRFQRLSILITLQCGRCFGYLHPHYPRGRNVAVPAFVLVFSFLALGIYTTEGKKIIIITHKTIFMVLSSTEQSHMREFTLGPLSESRSAPSGRQLVGQAANLTFESARRLLYAGIFTNRHLLLLNHLPSLWGSEDDRLSRTRHSSKCTARSNSCVSQ